MKRTPEEILQLQLSEVNAYRFVKQQDELEKAKRFLKQATEYLCSDDPDRGDYCRCGAHYEAYGMKHKRGCLYKRIKKFLKNSK